MHDYNEIISKIHRRNNLKHEELAANASHFDTYNDLVKNSNKLIGIYDYELDSPFWLNSDFEDFVWAIDIGNKNVKLIDWNEIILSDKSRLTEIKNKKTLDFFKYLILSPTCPVTNGGSIYKINSIHASISNSIKLINLILSNDDILNIGNSYSKLNNDFIFSILLKYSKGGYYHAIKYNERLERFITNLPYVVKNEKTFETFIEHYPFLLDNINTLFSSKEDKRIYIEHAYKLYINGFYKKSHHKPLTLHQPNHASVSSAIFGKIIIPLTSHHHINSLNKYQIKPEISSRKFKSINHFKDKDSISKSTITSLIYIIKHIPVSAMLAKIDNINIEPSTITLKRLKGSHDFKPVGRTFSLPPIFVLKSMEKAFELNLNKKFKKTDLWFPDLISKDEPVLMIDLLYDTILKFTEETKGLDRQSTLFKNIIRNSPFISKKLRRLGFNQFLNKNYLDRPEANSVVQFYKVIMGSIYVLTGALNARRVSELTNLPPVGNLKPSDKNPWKIKGFGGFSEYKLGFWPAKTGVGGEISLRDYVERPTPLIIAKLIYKLEKYNTTFIEKGFYSIEDISLFNGVSLSNFELHCLDTKQFNEAISYFCDYIETPTTVIDGEVYRYYILEHELRRFFALLFFWSSGDKKIDSLRHQLAHSDIQHLYNYISESVTGDVLNSTKASYLSYKFGRLNSTNLEKLNIALLNQFGVDSINLKTMKKFMDLYFSDDILDDDFNLNVDSEILLKQSKLEGQIQYLLNNDIITLEPEFFKNESNESTFNFAIKVKDLNNE